MFSAFGHFCQNIFGNIFGSIFKKLNIKISVNKSEKSIVNNINITLNSPSESDVVALVEKLRSLDSGDIADSNRYTPESSTAIGSTTVTRPDEKNLIDPIGTRDHKSEVRVDIDLNGKSVSDKSILGMLTSYCHHAPIIPFDEIISNPDQYDKLRIKYNLYGTMTGILYRGKNIALFTGSQANNNKLGNRISDVALMSGKSNIEHHRAKKYQYYSTVVEKWMDICALDFTHYLKVDPGIADGFFPLSKNSCASDSDRIGVYVAFGYPEDEQEYILRSKGRIRLNTVLRSIGAVFNDDHKSSVGKITGISDIDYDPKGMEGGPVFAVVYRDNGFVLKFAGIVSSTDNYKNGEITFIRVNAMIDILNSIVEMPDSLT